jgi:uncharacterized membrane protein
VFTTLAAMLHLGEDGRPVLPWLVGALLPYPAAFVITLGVNVPLKDGIKAAGDPDRIADLTAVRQPFNDTRWAARNIVRAVAATAAFGCLAWALLPHGAHRNIGRRSVRVETPNHLTNQPSACAVRLDESR